MARKPQDVTEAELSVLRLLWDHEEATIRELTDALYPGGSSSHYATVQKLLERLEAKRCVKRNRRRSPHRFSARIGRDELIGRRLESMAQDLCDGSFTPLLSHLVEQRRLSEQELRMLRSLIEPHADEEDES
ncbi:MAG: BlaI/MecI/CopY family transcriptional regulator [Planctomycetota bacterium]